MNWSVSGAGAGVMVGLKDWNLRMHCQTKLAPHRCTKKTKYAQEGKGGVKHTPTQSAMDERPAEVPDPMYKQLDGGAPVGERRGGVVKGAGTRMAECSHHKAYCGSKAHWWPSDWSKIERSRYHVISYFAHRGSFGGVEVQCSLSAQLEHAAGSLW